MLVWHALIAIIGKEKNPVLPITGRLVLHVCYKFVHNRIGRRNRLRGDAANSQVDLVTQMIAALIVIKIPHIILKNIGLYGIDRIERLITEQIILLLAAGEGEQTVVVPAVAKQKKVFWSILPGSGTVIEHLHKAAISSDIGCSRRELVIHLLCCNNLNR